MPTFERLLTQICKYVNNYYLNLFALLTFVSIFVLSNRTKLMKTINNNKSSIQEQVLLFEKECKNPDLFYDIWECVIHYKGGDYELTQKMYEWEEDGVCIYDLQEANNFFQLGMDLKQPCSKDWDAVNDLNRLEVCNG